MLHCGVDKGKEALQTIKKKSTERCVVLQLQHKNMTGFFFFLFNSITTSDLTTCMFLITRTVAVRRQFLPSVLGCLGLF